MGVEQNQQPKLGIKIGTISGKNQKEQYVWGIPELVGFVRVEVKGGQKPVQVSTKKVELNSEQALVLDEELELDIPEGAKEFRILLCHEKQLKGNKRAISVLAACGIYIQDIQDASPLQKTFQLYRPMQAGEGGSVDVYLNYVDKAAEQPPPSTETTQSTSTPENGQIVEQSSAFEKPSHQEIQSTTTKLETSDTRQHPRKLFTRNRVILFGAIVAAAIVGVTRLVVTKR
eukprot:TRINITY_DN37132_c0_g1_i1.p1 TRINITY_DN37132_c0_g1~~TRINITY_DN37132_c0_g1_i1.p1  ORF type:complete len:230 (-),score=59.24 TRINITY_DN37132_c0_g1_i1:283-972(-)